MDSNATTAPTPKQMVAAVRSVLPSTEFRIVLFGSRARGTARPDSDWDLGIQGPRPVTGEERQRIRDALEDLPTLHTFDVVDLTTARPALRDSAQACCSRLAG